MPHIHEKIDFCVEVFIVHNNKVLMRMHDKHKFWLSVGGHIELDEDPIEAAIREVKEEVGLNIKIAGPVSGPEDNNCKYLIPPKFMSRHSISDTHQHVVFIYFATSNTDVLVKPVHVHEEAETKWAGKEELHTMGLRPHILFYAEEALREFGKE